VAAVAGLPWKHFRAPLGSIVIGTFLVVAEPAFRANETAGEANNAKNAKATVTEVIDMGKAPLWFGRFAMLCCGHSMGPMIPFFFEQGAAPLRRRRTFTPEFRGSPLRRRDCRARIGLQS
jgi:hypothetical protein